MKVTGFHWRKKHPPWLCGYRGIYRAMGGTNRTKRIIHIGAGRMPIYCGAHYWLGNTAAFPSNDELRNDLYAYALTCKWPWS